LGEIAAGTPSITRYVTATSTLESIIRTISAGSDPYIGADDWNLVNADGNYYSAFFISVDGLEFVELSGSIYGELLDPMTLSAGYNWIARPAQLSSLFYSWSARTMLANILNSVELYRFNEDKQNYENAIIEPGSGAFIGDDFHIDASEGYIIKVSAASQWDINTPASVLLAATSQKFDNITGVTSSLLTRAAERLGCAFR